MDNSAYTPKEDISDPDNEISSNSVKRVVCAYIYIYNTHIGKQI